MTNISAEEALELLIEGNKRFVKGESVHPNQTIDYREHLESSQRPVAVVIGCSDSRVPPEVIFDVGLGDIFVIRVAGTTVGNVCTGSLEFALEHLNVKLVIVLGHENCGLITKAAGGEDFHHHLGSLVQTAKLAVANTKDMPGNPVENATKENVRLLIDRLDDMSPTIDKFYKSGDVKMVGAYYNLKSGRVDFMD
ncbi:carbonic anhydrase [Patescibacteria group bacterium]